MLSHEALSTNWFTIDQIQQGKQVNPHNVHEMPIQSRDFKGCVILRRKAPLVRHPSHDGEYAHADDHVDCVHASQCEIKRIKNFRVLLDVFLSSPQLYRVVLDLVDTQQML